jgi:hypothetical protein
VHTGNAASRASTGKHDRSQSIVTYERLELLLLKEFPLMKKMFALIFAIALSISMSSFAFAQTTTAGDNPLDQREGTRAKHHHKHHHKHRRNTTQDHGTI